MKVGKKTSVETKGSVESTGRAVARFWRELSFVDDLDGTTWDVLGGLRSQVMELLAQGTEESIDRASALTAHAVYILKAGAP